MKIGILTFHNAHNYGAALQAYALKRYLEKIGCDVDILNYENPELKRKYDKKLNVQISKNDYIHPGKLIQFLKFRLLIPFMQTDWERKCDKFNQFIKCYLFNEVEDFEVLMNNQFASYDCLIVGSDQVWASNLTAGLDNVFFLDFQTDAKKCSYGASVTYVEIPDSEIAYFEKALSDFDYLSVREETLKNEIRSKLEFDATVVVDPTLLLESEEYDCIMSSTINVDEAFVFAYFIVDDPIMRKAARVISKKLGLRLIELHYFQKKFNKNKDYIADIGPCEFLWYMRNADFVITNSFHGVIFSLIFERQFYAIYGKDARKDSLLASVDLRKRHLCKISNEQSIERIDYEMVKPRINKNREQSYRFLRKIVNDISESEK